MRRNSLTLLVGALLLVIFLLLLFTFQVRQTEVAVVTTFDRPTGFIDQPGLKFKWPRPIQRVYIFDKRIQNFEDRFEQALTSDNYSVLVNVYSGWTIVEPQRFFSSFPAGTAAAAEPALAGLIESAKNAAIGRHPFTDFVSTDPKQLKFVEIENEMLNAVKQDALSKYGIGIQFLRIKRLGLPESVTQKVFDRMTAERGREVERLKAQGDAEAMNIKSAADRDRAEILAKAESDATAIRGQADAEAAKSFAAFEQNPELAVFLLKLKALEQTLKDRSTLILDERTSPFDLLNKPAAATQPRSDKNTRP